ncbi:alpha-L-fucosidase [Lacinutrix sp. C3R15]|uniref:alpha-L-fucosidase n=1 Tax=Flavobacteriaceae TaxID=49546 RepID=UPI001C086C77|nr:MULTISPECIES: alpha-L-fucosidase [Flavobacteriaceae]MBU2939187.1 alpha-L-fucosidase [Lacinutrix sp. C3R15]MDO6622503.1 alpha-L-fucosidase [Oceanihabitans sp. 1_MG-2023]
MKKGIVFILSAALLLSGSLLSAQTEKTTSDEELMGWFRDARFGMFIHFGASTSEDFLEEGLNKTERYEKSVKNFNPVDFDAKEWVRIAKNAGMKYIVFTTKHHDGFCKWDSKLTDWDVMDATPFKRDIVGELAEACKEENIELGFYYSIADWHHPEYDATYSNRQGFHFNPNPEADITKYMDYMYGQIKELCENYQPKLFWFDGSAGFRNPNKKRLLGQQEMVDLLNSYGAISNSRLGDDDTLEYVNYLSMGDNMTPSGNIGADFESAQTMNDNWHFKKGDDNWKSAKTMLGKLIDIAGNGGNYLLNVGPNSKGIIPKESQSRLKIMGEWLQKNGEAIYGTTAGPYPYEFTWGSITQRIEENQTTLYLNVIDWPKEGVFKVYGLNNSIEKASLLASGDELSHESEFNPDAGANVISIKVPKSAPDPYVSVIALTIKGEAKMDQTFLQQQDGSVVLDAFRSTIHDEEFVPNKPQRPLDQRIFTVMKKGKGIMPTRGMSVGLDKEGQALRWDFRMLKSGKYKVAVVSSVKEEHPWKADGKMRVTVAGESIENKLIEQERYNNERMATEMKCSVAVLGTIEINTVGMNTLTLEVTSGFTDATPNIISVQLLPIEK